MNYFENCNTINLAKERWRQLCKEHHPDTGGSVEIMQEINSQYAELLVKLKGPAAPCGHGRVYNQDRELDFTEAINEFKSYLKKFGLPDYLLEVLSKPELKMYFDFLGMTADDFIRRKTNNKAGAQDAINAVKMIGKFLK